MFDHDCGQPSSASTPWSKRAIVAAPPGRILPRMDLGKRSGSYLRASVVSTFDAMVIADLRYHLTILRIWFESWSGPFQTTPVTAIAAKLSKAAVRTHMLVLSTALFFWQMTITPVDREDDLSGVQTIDPCMKA